MNFTQPSRCRASVVLLLVFFTGGHQWAAAQPTAPKSFAQIVQTKAANGPACKLTAACACSMDDEYVASRLLAEYGSIFAAADTVKSPKRCIFESESQVSEFQRGLKTSVVVMDGATIELQEPAMAALLAAKQDAAEMRLRITPFDGATAGKRSYMETVRIWNSRYHRALDHWVRVRRISVDEANAARYAPVVVQVRKVIAWERAGLNFGTGLGRSIFSSTAPPGTSQHLSMLAFDVVQHSNRDVRRILNSNGWFQTIANDPPHFTYLGVPESELPARGLKAVYAGGQKYWVPDITLPQPVEDRPTAVSPTTVP